MLDVKVREIMDNRLKADETILWADSADPLVRAKSQGMTPKDRIWNYLGALFFLVLFLFHGYESFREGNLVRLSLNLLFLAFSIYVILFSRGHIPNPFVKNNVGEQYDHYIVTNHRLFLFQKNINKRSVFPITSVDHASIVYPKSENFLTISFLDDPDEARMLSLNGVKDFSEAKNIINRLVGHPRRQT